MKTYTLKSLLFIAVTATLASCSTDADVAAEANANELPSNKTLIFTTSNNSNTSEILVSEAGSLTTERLLTGTGMDAAGVFYDHVEDCLVQASRSDREVRLYDNIKTTPNGSVLNPVSISADGFLNARDIASASNGKIIVSSDAAQNGQSNKFYIYDVTPAGLVFDKVFVTSNQNWGIDINGSDLYAVNDNSNRISIFNNVFTQTGQILDPTNQIFIEGATSLKGMTYHAGTDMMIVTDVRNQFNDSDGAIIIIDNFSSKLNAAGSFGTIARSQYRIIEGSNTKLGTPLDVQLDAAAGIVYVAERSTNSGAVIAYDVRNTGINATPVSVKNVRGVSSIFLKN